MEINQVKIAVIEDDENMRLLIAQRLIQEGFQVIEAAEGNAAHALILEEQPHIVLLDSFSLNTIYRNTEHNHTISLIE